MCGRAAAGALHTAVLREQVIHAGIANRAGEGAADDGLCCASTDKSDISPSKKHLSRGHEGINSAQMNTALNQFSLNCGASRMLRRQGLERV